MKQKLAAGLFASIVVMGLVISIVAAISNAETDEFIREVDEFLEQYENRTDITRPEPSYEFEEYMRMMAAQAKEKPEYTWNQEMIGKVVAYEVGWCCYRCRYMVASACINRFYGWYDRDVVAMITDNNGSYYMMNPEYVYADEMNGINFWEAYDDVMPVVATATERPAECWYWDNEDTQGEWAELVWHCEEDGCWFYR